jgi:asparagine synthase (glutamine-hydrolysing)
MSGFVGICGDNLSLSNQALEDAVKATIYSKKTIAKDVCSDDHLMIKKSFNDFLETSEMASYDQYVHVWIDGEIYNQEELSKDEHEGFSKMILRSYLEDSLEDLLKKVDGIYIAIIYDLKRKQIQVVTDRYGLKPFYIYLKNNCLIFAPELKCFPYLRPFTLQIRSDVVNCFMKLEHFVGTATWFEGVELTEPSMIYNYSWQDDKLTKKRYWSWSAIQQSSLSIESAAEEMSFLLDNAIKSRSFGSYKVGVALSGGFDSRAILAAIYQDNPITYTFGIKESADVRIAKKVAAQAGVKHIHFDMKVDDWLLKRFSGVWKTDGMLNMYHMHYSHLMDEIPKIMDVNLSGFLGDAVIGGTYLDRKKGKPFLDRRMNEDIARQHYGDYSNFCDPSDSFFDINKIDPYLFYNRGRRMIGLGAEEANKTIHQRLPFMDIKLMDFSYSLPDTFRKDSNVYQRSLLLRYPDFYKKIPHATSGVPISIDPSIFHRSKKLYHRLLWIAKYKLGIATSFTDVYNWIKEPDTANFIRNLLDPKYAIYPSYTQTDFLKTYFEPHVAGKGNYSKQVMGALTMEIWLQQVINRKHIDTFSIAK